MNAGADSEFLTIRLLLAHWPDDSYILRGVTAQFGEAAAEAVKLNLDARREALERDLATRFAVLASNAKA
jgi:hypothetical protein